MDKKAKKRLEVINKKLQTLRPRLTGAKSQADDLEEITTYIARDSTAYARAVASKVLATAKSLGQFPGIGRMVPEAGDEAVRERFVYSYRVIYRIEQHRVLVLAIVHGRRLLADVQDRFPRS